MENHQEVKSLISFELQIYTEKLCTIHYLI